MSTPSGSSSPQIPEGYFQILEKLREMVRTGRSLLPAHAEFKPDWDHHLQRLDNIERLVRKGGADNLRLADQLYQDFMLEYQADMATTMSETAARMVRFNDMIAKKIEEKKFELPAETRDELEDIIQPYHDGMRDKLLEHIPLEERRIIEEDKRRLDEE